MCRVRLHPFPGRARRARCLNPRGSSMGPPGRVATRASSTPERVCAPRLAHPRAPAELGIERGIILSPLESEARSAGQRRCARSFERGKRLLALLGTGASRAGKAGRTGEKEEKKARTGFCLSTKCARLQPECRGGGVPVSGNRTRCLGAAGGGWRGRDRREGRYPGRRGAVGALPGQGAAGAARRLCGASGSRCRRPALRGSGRGARGGRGQEPSPAAVAGGRLSSSFGLCRKFGGCLLSAFLFILLPCDFFVFSLKEKKNLKPLVLCML